MADSSTAPSTGVHKEQQSAQWDEAKLRASLAKLEQLQNQVIALFDLHVHYKADCSRLVR